MFWAIITTFFGAMMAVAMIIVRLRASKRPTNIARIILPPLFMSTGAFMFLFPMFRVQWPQVIEAFSVGVLFSILLIKTTRFEIRDNQVYLIPSKLFVLILIGLLIIRIALKLYFGNHVPVGETSGMFFLLAFGMIISWRIAMLIKYRKLARQL